VEKRPERPTGQGEKAKIKSFHFAHGNGLRKQGSMHEVKMRSDRFLIYFVGWQILTEDVVNFIVSPKNSWY